MLWVFKPQFSHLRWTSSMSRIFKILQPFFTAVASCCDNKSCAGLRDSLSASSLRRSVLSKSTSRSHLFKLTSCAAKGSSAPVGRSTSVVFIYTEMPPQTFSKRVLVSSVSLSFFGWFVTQLLQQVAHTCFADKIKCLTYSYHSYVPAYEPYICGSDLNKQHMTWSCSPEEKTTHSVVKEN